MRTREKCIQISPTTYCCCLSGISFVVLSIILVLLRTNKNLLHTLTSVGANRNYHTNYVNIILIKRSIHAVKNGSLALYWRLRRYGRWIPFFENTIFNHSLFLITTACCVEKERLQPPVRSFLVGLWQHPERGNEGVCSCLARCAAYSRRWWYVNLVGSVAVRLEIVRAHRHFDV